MEKGILSLGIKMKIDKGRDEIPVEGRPVRVRDELRVGDGAQCDEDTM